ncbi:MAG: tRNA pseudouridine(38-40) synthase TruA [Fusobacteriaceae bacterium]
MKNFKITYMYDGTDFFGFQRQKNTRTVQGVIEKTIMTYVDEPINLVSAGRTDKGVHSNSQVSNFFTRSKIPAETLLKILNESLPIDIVIKNIEEVSDHFSARFNTKQRIYRYFFSQEQNPFKNRFATFLPREVDIKKLAEIMQVLVGRHDFGNFRLSNCTSQHQVREIFEISSFETSENFGIEIRGNAFLKSQVRIIIGTALDIYFEKKPANTFLEMLSNLDQEFLKKVAPPNGLFLWEVLY